MRDCDGCICGKTREEWNKRVLRPVWVVFLNSDCSRPILVSRGCEFGFVEWTETRMEDQNWRPSWVVDALVDIVERHTEAHEARVQQPCLCHDGLLIKGSRRRSGAVWALSILSEPRNRFFSRWRGRFWWFWKAGKPGWNLNDERLATSAVRQ